MLTGLSGREATGSSYVAAHIRATCDGLHTAMFLLTVHVILARPIHNAHLCCSAPIASSVAEMLEPCTSFWRQLSATLYSVTMHKHAFHPHTHNLLLLLYFRFSSHDLLPQQNL